MPFTSHNDISARYVLVSSYIDISARLMLVTSHNDISARFILVTSHIDISALLMLVTSHIDISACFTLITISVFQYILLRLACFCMTYAVCANSTEQSSLKKNLTVAELVNP